MTFDFVVDRGTTDNNVFKVLLCFVPPETRIIKCIVLCFPVSPERHLEAIHC